MINIDNVKPTSTSAIATCVFTFFSVQLMIFLLDRSFYLRLDIIYLAAVTMGLTGPLLMVNALLYSLLSYEPKHIREKNKNDPEDQEKKIWINSGVLSVIFIAFITLLGHSYKWSLYKSFWILFWVEIVFAVFFTVGALNSRSKKIP